MKIHSTEHEITEIIKEKRITTTAYSVALVQFSVHTGHREGKGNNTEIAFGSKIQNFWPVTNIYCSWFSFLLFDSTLADNKKITGSMAPRVPDVNM